MDEQALTDYIVDQLGKHRRVSDIIADVCERTGMHWAEAQKIVYDVAYEQRRGVAARRGPLVLAFGIALIVFGLFVVVVMLSALGNGISFMIYGISYAGNLLGLGMGALLIAGGVIGIWKHVKTFLE